MNVIMCFFSTRVVQRLIQTVKTRRQISLLKTALEPGFLDLIKDLHGNHVVQRCLHGLSNEDNKVRYSFMVILISVVAILCKCLGITLRIVVHTTTHLFYCPQRDIISVESFILAVKSFVLTFLSLPVYITYRTQMKAWKIDFVVSIVSYFKQLPFSMK